ncbi:MAG: DUF3883 domain-containing protein, partial [Pseudomonadota bacterium]
MANFFTMVLRPNKHRFAPNGESYISQALRRNQVFFGWADAEGINSNQSEEQIKTILKSHYGKEYKEKWLTYFKYLALEIKEGDFIACNGGEKNKWMIAKIVDKHINYDPDFIDSDSSYCRNVHWIVREPIEIDGLLTERHQNTIARLHINKSQQFILSLFKNDYNNEEIKKRTLSDEQLQKLIKEKNEIGRLGEEYVLEYENRRLNELGINRTGRPQAKFLSDVGAGYDILSLDKNGNNIFIEVKTTRGAKESDFY